MENNDKPRSRPRIGMAPRANNPQSTPGESQHSTRPYHEGPANYQTRQTGEGYTPHHSQSYQGQQGNYRPNYRPQRPGQGQGNYRPNYHPQQGQGNNTTDGENYRPNYRPQRSGQGNYNPNYRPSRPDQGEGNYNPNYRPQRPGQGNYNPNYRRQQGNGNYNPNYRNNNQQQGRPFQKPQRANQFGMPQGGKSFVPKPRPVEYEQPIVNPEDELRLNKYMANAGICSRREADDLIQKGLISVNGNPVTELGTKIKYGDVVEYDGKVVTLEKKCYVLLNKPKDCVTTCDDPKGRKTVMEIIKGATRERIYPVGRLDRMTTGVLLLTNDGELASKLTHPQYVKKKIYHVWTDKDISEDDMQAIADGIELEDGPIHADAISYATDTDRNQAGIEIHSGKNRIIRRIFEHLGYHVTKLDRVYFAGLTKKNLPRGRWRYLTQEEVTALQTGRFE